MPKLKVADIIEIYEVVRKKEGGQRFPDIWKEVKKEFLELAQKEKIWVLLGSLEKNNQTEKFVRLFEETCVQTDALYLLTMLMWQIQQLLEIKAGTFVGAPFRKSSLESQARKFTEEELIKLYNTLIDLDFRAKSGGLKTTVEQELLQLLFAI